MHLIWMRQTKGKSPEIADLVDQFAVRCQKMAKIEIQAPKSRGTENPEQASRYQPPAIWSHPSSRRIVLDEKGTEWSSRDLADRIRTWKDDPAIKTVCFFIGGPFGAPPTILDSAHLRWSLSKATLSADVAWLVFAEQIYRSLSILAGSPYHHD